VRFGYVRPPTAGHHAHSSECPLENLKTYLKNNQIFTNAAIAPAASRKAACIFCHIDDLLSRGSVLDL